MSNSFGRRPLLAALPAASVLMGGAVRAGRRKAARSTRTLWKRCARF